MKLSTYLLPTLKEQPVEASVASHQLMLRAGMIKQIASGLYDWLPFGRAVLQKIEKIIREEMNKIGAMEVTIPCIQPASLWKDSGRLGQADDLNKEMLKMEDRAGHQMLFSPTAEEAMVNLLQGVVRSYKSLPLTLYQINWKFRDEIRPRYGVMRSREFLMKDAYSFHIDQSSALAAYEVMLQAYLKIYKRLGLNAIPVAADTGSMGGNYSHEFHVLADTGESTIFYDQQLESVLQEKHVTLESLRNLYAVEESKHDVINCAVPKENLLSKKGIEVGHMFYLGNKYTQAMNFAVQTRDGVLCYPDMGCYGIGVSRLVGALIEANHDQHGIIWSESVAPFQYMVINLRVGNADCDRLAMVIMNKLNTLNVTYLYDDLDESVGTKLARADLIGLPKQIIIGPKQAQYNKFEVKNRHSGDIQIVDIEFSF